MDITLELSGEDTTEGTRLMGGRTAERKLDVENAMLGVMPGKFAELL